MSDEPEDPEPTTGGTDPASDGGDEPDEGGDPGSGADPDPETGTDGAGGTSDEDAEATLSTGGTGGEGDPDPPDADATPFEFGEEVPPVENGDDAGSDGNEAGSDADEAGGDGGGITEDGDEIRGDGDTDDRGGIVDDGDGPPATGNGEDPDAGGLRKGDRDGSTDAAGRSTDAADHPRPADRRDPIDPADPGADAGDGATPRGGTVPESNVEFDDDEVADPVAEPDVTVADPGAGSETEGEAVDGTAGGDGEAGGSPGAAAVEADPAVEADGEATVESETDPGVEGEAEPSVDAEADSEPEIEREAEVGIDGESHPGGGDSPGVDTGATVPPDEMADPIPGPGTEPEGPPDDEEMPLADHIEEMVSRLGVVVVAVAAATALAFPFAEQVLVTMWYDTLPAAASDPHIYGPLEKILAEIKVASLAGVLVALPVLVYESYLFMRPGLYPKERRYYLAAVPTSLVLGAIGMAFAYFLVLPVLFRYFVFYSKSGVDKLAFGLRVTFDLIVAMLGAFAVVFQIPLLIMLAIMMGVTSRRWLEQRRLYFWGGFLGLGFLMGGADLTGMAPIIIAATMIGLFEGTLLLLRWTQR